MTSDFQASPGRRRQARRKGSAWRRGWAPGIRIRVLTIALIPSVALFITGVSVAGSLISGALSARDFASQSAHSTGTLLQFTSSLEQERTLSLRALGGDGQAHAGLQAQWDTTNAKLSQLSTAAKANQGANPQALASSNAALDALASKMARVRHSVQTGRASVSAVDAFYTQFAGISSSVFLQVALTAPSNTAAVDMVTALDLFAVPDTHSRVVGLGASWVTRGVVLQSERVELAQLTGAYRNQLQALVSRLSPAGQAAYARIAAGGAWQLATSGEDELAEGGKLAVPVASWLAAENTVSADLLGIWAADIRDAEKVSVSAANHTLSRSVLVGSLVLVLAVAAFAPALVLANGLVRRLRRLRAKTLELADVTLPSMVRRIGDGEPVDIESEVAMSGYGSDEIGQVAEAFSTAQRTAAAAAVAEASTRAGINKVFLDIAHRSQLVVHRQLELLDVAEAKQSDPEHLELLFQLDHLATRARRNAENLLILGGGQPGRKWRRPAALEDIVRSAVSETEHFARVSTVRLPDVQIQGSVVGDLIHLLAELVDNATVFSPPDAAVTVRGNRVGKGVVVEVEDQGLGIAFTERERLNATLANPPGFQEMALSGQRHLGLFVVGQLAQRHGVMVSLLESAYGGTKAIVLVPADVIQTDSTAAADSATTQNGQGTNPRRLRAVEPSQEPVPPRPDWPAPSPGPRNASPRPGSGQVQRGRTALPRRERMANLAPGLRPSGQTEDDTRPRRPRSPDQARGSMSAFQRGTRLGRDSQDQESQ